jgi:PLP dependent protein
MTESIADRLARVRERIAAAAARRGPGPCPLLVGVSKRQPIAAVAEAVEAGLLDFGENYGQELRDKRRVLTAPIRWHFIGPIQTNKVKLVVGTHLLHTVDRAELLDAIEHRARSQGVRQSVLIQVNIAGETAKHGADPDALPALLDRFAGLEHVVCRGLMLIPPLLAPEQTRPHFAALRRLRDHLARTQRPHVELVELSMGMSSDFEVAIAEGATIVRVGTAIFGSRPG